MKKPSTKLLDVAPVRKPRAASLVAESLRRYIFERGLGPGDPFPSERDLAAAFAVSRIVIRETLQTLENQGLILVHHGQRTVVTGRPDGPGFPSPLEPDLQLTSRHGLEARSILEAGTADLVIERATGDDLGQLEEIVEEMRHRLKSRRPAVEEDVAFHRHLVHCTHNPEIVRIVYHEVANHIRATLRYRSVVSLLDPEIVHPDEHAAIVGAIKQRNIERLRLLLRYHGYPLDERLAAGVSVTGRGAVESDRGGELPTDRSG